MRLIRLAAVLAALATPAAAQQLVGEYVAYIGPQDLVNSKGARLKEPWQILRQDRANFHRFGKGDPQDGWDGFFHDAGNRENMERMLMQGSIDPAARRAILTGGAVVHVQIWGRGNRGDYITVGVY